MEFYDVLKFRRSYRGYSADPVPAEALQRIAEAVRLAPTACNRQPCRIMLYGNPAQKQKICSVYQQAWLAEAPYIAVLLGNESLAWRRLEGDTIIPVDAAITMEHFILAAAAEGLGTCWICAFQRAELAKVMNFEPGWAPVAISPLGHPKLDCVRPNTSKPASELFKVID